jgi:hypothetical protein
MIESEASSLKGQGTIYYVCASCGNMVLKGMSAEQSEALASVLFACTPCNMLMRIPARTIAYSTARAKQNSGVPQSGRGDRSNRKKPAVTKAGSK